MGLIPTPYAFLAKVLGAIVAVVVIFGAGYYEGYKNTSNAEKARVVERVEVQARALPAETQVLTKTVTQIKTVHDKVYIDVPKLIQDNRACDVPAAAVGLLNSNRALPASN